MSKQVNSKQNPSLNQEQSIYDKYINGKELYFLMGLVLLSCYIIFSDFIHLKKIYLFKDIGSDSLNASWPYMTHTMDMLSSTGFPTWSFSFGMGQNMSTFGFYDPFDVLIYLLGKNNMMYLLVFKEILKIFLTSIFFYKYLKLINVNSYTAIAGALLYSFCGYMIVGSGWFIFSFEVFNLSFLLWSFEMFFQKNKWYWFPIPIFLIGISRPFNFWLFGLFIISYLILRIYQSDIKLNLKSISFLVLKLFGIVILGIGLSAPLFLEHVQAMINSPRGSGPDSYFHVLSSGDMFATPDKIQFGTEVLRFFSSDILGSGIQFKGWQNYLEAPLFYGGLICLLLLPQAFQFLDKRIRLVSIIILLIWTLPIVFPYFRQALWMFSGDYYRVYSFFVSVMLIIYSVIALNHIIVKKSINLKVLIGSVVMLLFLLNYPFFKDKSTIDSSILMLVIIFLFIYVVLLYFIVNKTNNQNYKLILLICLFTELSYFSWCSVNRRDHVRVSDLKQKIGYNDYTIEAVDFIKKTDKSFYRIDKSYTSTPAIHGSLNDALVFNYYGTSCYNSFNQLNYINYFKTMGVISKINETESRWSPGLINRFILESLNSVKYVLTKNTNNPVWINSFDSIAKFGDVTVLKNKNVMPLGFAYERYLYLSEFDHLSSLQKDIVSTKACVINDDEKLNFNELKKYQLKDTLPLNLITFDLIKNNIDSLRANVFIINKFSQTEINGSINVGSTGKIVYFSMPFDDGWRIIENGNEILKFKLSNGMTGIYLKKGKHNIELEYTSDNIKNGIKVLIVSISIFIVLIIITFIKKYQFLKR